MPRYFGSRSRTAGDFKNKHYYLLLVAENKFEQEPISAPDLIWVKPTPQTKEKGKLVPFTGKKAFMLSCYGWDVREEHVFLSNFQAEIKPCLLVQGHDSVLEQSTTCSHRSVLESPLSVWQKHPPVRDRETGITAQ